MRQRVGHHLRPSAARKRRELAREPPLFAAKVHAGIVAHGGFGHGGEEPVAEIEGRRHIEQLVFGQRGVAGFGIEPFVRGSVGGQRQHQRQRIARRIEGRQFVVHRIGAPARLLRELVAEADPFVEDPHHQIDAAERRLALDERNPSLVGAGAGLGGFAHDQTVGLVDAAAFDAADLQTAAERPAVELESQPSAPDHGTAVGRDVVGDAFGSDIERETDAFVRRDDLHLPAGPCERSGEEDNRQQKKFFHSHIIGSD